MISHRVAYAVATGVVRPPNVLLVTFTEKAAAEMMGRLTQLGLPGVTARTFHAAALAQLRHFWPRAHADAPLPQILDSKLPIVGRLARALPGGYRFTPAKDLADEIEWAKSRRIAPEEYAARAGSRTPPVPVEIFARLFADYERAKRRMGAIDFEDMLALTIELLEDDPGAAEQVRGKYRWFSVDEYQDTNAQQERLLELWVGERRDLCVVGDEDQTIYSFTGASSSFLTGFARRWPGARVVALTENYRSSPQVLELANRLIASSGRAKRLTATQPPGPAPQIRSFADDALELDAVSTEIRRLIGDGIPPSEIAVLVRLNAQIPAFEQALTRAGIPYRVRGQRFFDRADVRRAIGLIRRARLDVQGGPLPNAISELWRTEMGYVEDEVPEGREAREQYDALSTLLAILREQLASDASLTADAFLAELAGRADVQDRGSEDGVNLLTLHRAKGLEWDAVFLPALEEGLVPVRQAGDDDEAVAEERRLLYVGITRARRHLVLSWATRRTNAKGVEQNRRMSRFLAGLSGGRPSRSASDPGLARPAVRSSSADSDGPLIASLKTWRRERASRDGVPAYVVLHDSTLTEICERQPRSIAELRRIKGMGPAKLEKYGPEIVAVIAETAGA